MYIWQFYSESTGLVMGHYWMEFVRLLQRIHEHYGAVNPRFIIYVHNLPFEMSFFLDQLAAAGYIGKIFATAAHKPICYTLDDLCIEFRCSYKLTNKGLAKYLEDMHTGYEKMTGDLDYRIQRTPKSILDPDTELAYCAADVIGLYYALQADLKQTGDTVASVPLTSTGYVRRELRKVIADDKNYQCLLKRSALDWKRYKLVKQLAKGGDTLASASQLIGKVQHNIGSYDFVSSYPAQLMTKKYPMGKLGYEGSGAKIDLDYIHYIRNVGRYFILQCVVYNLEVKEKMLPIPCITRSKDYFTENELVYNGRLLRADRAGLAFDMISFELFERQYKWDKIVFGDVYSCEYDYLPEKIRNFVYQYFEGKCKLADERKKYKKYSPEWNAITLDYNIYKGMLNGIFGMLYTDCLKGDNSYDFNRQVWDEELPKVLCMDDADDLLEELLPEKQEEWLKEMPADTPDHEAYLQMKEKQWKEELIELNREKLYRNQCSGVGVYLWGCHTASLGRAALDEMIRAAGYYNVCYSDTDSIKVKSTEQAREGLKQLNKRLEALAVERGAVVDTGKNRYVLGIAEDETGDDLYTEFVTLGAKKYCYRDSEGLHLTVSGVSKDQVYQLQDNIENFRKDFVFAPAGGILLHYIHDEMHTVHVTGDDGTEDDIQLGNSIYCEERTITLGGISDQRFGKDFTIYSDIFGYIDEDDEF